MTRFHHSLVMIFMLLMLFGCASPSVSIGSKTWHEIRIAEIEEAYQNDEIRMEKYLQLKMQADKIRQKYYSQSRYYPSTNYRHYNHH